MGPGGPPVAAPRRLGDHGELQGQPPCRLSRRAPGKRFHHQRAARRPAGGAGHLLPRAARGSRIADDPIPAELKLPNGEMWKNIVTEEKSKPAETLAEFRGAYKYNLMDKNALAFNREIPIFSQWDDHEVTNNWWPGEPLTRAEHLRKKYVDKNVLAMAARASRAFHEYMPMRQTQAEAGRVYRKISYGPLLDVFMLDMRSYRGANTSPDDRFYRPDDYLLGPVQTAWLKRELARSR